MAGHAVIQIYAELLPNIRQVTVSATLPSLVDASTTADIFPDGLTLRVRHGGAQQVLQLPGPVAAAGTRLAVEKSPQARKGTPGDDRCVTWRLPLRAESRALVAGLDGTAPWSAHDLPPGAPVVCRSCRGELVAAGRTAVWKDLPSDNWAEMMEFWHCHKPEVPGQSHDHGHGYGQGNSQGNGQEKATSENLAARGYGANSAIAAQAGVGFVDLMALLFAESDCQGMVFSPSTRDKGLPDRQSVEDALPAGSSSLSVQNSLRIFCASCDAQIGYFHARMLAVTLFKWQIACGPATAHLPTVTECLSAAVLTTIARTGSAQSLVMPLYASSSSSSSAAAAVQKIPHLWAVNNNIRYASSSRDKPAWAIKLLYKLIDRAEADALLEKIQSSIQEINLPEECIQQVLADVESSHALLPTAHQWMGAWKVGLLERHQSDVSA